MAARAQASIAQAEAVAGGDGAAADGSGLLDTLASARAAFDVLLARLSSASERARGGAERVTSLQELAQRVETGIAKVDSIAMSVRLLALNAKIEVARDGDRSAGFAVVATEMERCAGQSSEIAEYIRDTAKELTVTLHGVAAALREEADRAARDMATSRADIENALRDVERTHEQISARLNDARHMSRDLARDIGMAVMSLQFQDRVSQRVGHVIEALARMHDALDAARPVLTNGTRLAADRRREEVAEETSRTHTMAEERTVLRVVPATPPDASSSTPASSAPAQSAPSSGDVELF
jgi:methyl-accepting chemotaxis protein